MFLLCSANKFQEIVHHFVLLLLRGWNSKLLHSNRFFIHLRLAYLTFLGSGVFAMNGSTILHVEPFCSFSFFQFPQLPHPHELEGFFRHHHSSFAFYSLSCLHTFASPQVIHLRRDAFLYFILCVLGKFNSTPPGSKQKAIEEEDEKHLWRRNILLWAFFVASSATTKAGFGTAKKLFLTTVAHTHFRLVIPDWGGLVISFWLNFLCRRENFFPVFTGENFFD